MTHVTTDPTVVALYLVNLDGALDQSVFCSLNTSSPFPHVE